MRKLFLSIMLVSPILMAGTSSVDGSAEVSRQNDYVEFDLTVNSQCYKTEAEASDANNELVASVQEVLERYRSDGEYDAVYTSGSWVGGYSESVYDEERQRSRTICKNTYQQNTVITFRTSDIDGFSDNYRAIKEGVFALSMTKAQDEEDPRDSVQMSTPFAQICKETKKEAVSCARKLAANDAICKAKDYLEGFGLNCKLTVKSFTDRVEPSYASSESYRVAPAAMKGGDSSSTVQLNFAPQIISSTVRVEFTWGNGKERSTKIEKKRQARLSRQERRDAVNDLD